MGGVHTIERKNTIRTNQAIPVYSCPMAPDPHRTDHCPRGHRCESCGIEGSTLAVVIRAVLGEVMCVTLCRSCADSGRPPQVMLSTAERLVDAHRRHLDGYLTHD
jgi:hypothetical protein